MRQQEVFGAARWVGAPSPTMKTFSVLRRHFTVHDIKKATLRVVGLGFFTAYLNGKRASEDRFLPLSTDFAAVHEPIEEVLTGHRLYVPEYDVTTLLVEGENTLAIHFGGGWYTFEARPYGMPKAIYSLTVETETETLAFVSSTMDKIGAGAVTDYELTQREIWDYTKFDEDCLGTEFDDCAWVCAAEAEAPETEYLFSDCPADRVTERLSPVYVTSCDEGRVYDCGKNISGVPVLRINAARGTRVEVEFAEECLTDGRLDPAYRHKQYFACITDGREHTVSPEFMWFGFRYLCVRGDATLLSVDVIHSNVAITSTFDSDSETLNWLYRAYLNTQLCNMHAGIPSDCPHLERRGYTGDGQLTCHAAMLLTDADAFYRKWIADIGDCQDTISGHVQYTAPYTRCGGGPGGWGCAIIEVPYQFYKHYGDDKPLKTLYPQMRRYFDYLEEHSENLLVTSDKKGEWCLGDWCAPTDVILPAPFVNNYFYIKSLGRMIEIAKIIGKEEDIPAYEKTREIRLNATRAAYYNTWDRNFIGNLQGANAFAVDIGLGVERTYRNLVSYYERTGCYDTGIFGTDIVTRVLFEHGDGEVASKLLLSDAEVSFEGQRRHGATTLWEYWTEGRSHSHPMFGAVTAYLFEYLLGIRQAADSVAYRHIVIAPVLVSSLGRLFGSIKTAAGTIAVSYQKKEGEVHFTLNIPEGGLADFHYDGKTLPLSAGETSLVFPL